MGDVAAFSAKGCCGDGVERKKERMPTRSFTVVFERATDTEQREYIARVPALDELEERGRTPDQARERIAEAIVSACVSWRREPGVREYPRDDPKPWLEKVKVVLPVPPQVVLDRIHGPRD